MLRGSNLAWMLFLALGSSICYARGNHRTSAGSTSAPGPSSSPRPSQGSGGALEDLNDGGNETALMSQGRPARIGQFPSFVALANYNPGAELYKHLCSGAIISSKAILTLASCVENYEEEDDGGKEVRVAATIYPADRWTEKNVKSYKVSRVCKSKDYEQGELNHDNYAIVVLKKKMNLDKNMAKAKLPTKKLTQKDKIIAVGIGDLDDEGQRANILQYAQVRYTTDDENSATFVHGKASHCKRDSGGPFYRSKTSAASGELVALLTNSDDDCHKEAHGIDIHKYLSKINKLKESCISGGKEDKEKEKEKEDDD